MCAKGQGRRVARRPAYLPPSAYEWDHLLWHNQSFYLLDHGFVMDLCCDTLRASQRLITTIKTACSGVLEPKVQGSVLAQLACFRFWVSSFPPTEVGKRYVWWSLWTQYLPLTVDVTVFHQDLKDYMRQAGEVTYADAHKQRRNEGVVEFASFSDMKTAIEKLDDTDLSGRRIKLVEDKSRRRRSRSRSRSKSHSRSHSRSKSRSKSPSYSKSRSRSKSRSKSRSHSKSPSKSRSNRSQSRKQSHSRSRSMSEERRDRKSRSRSKSRKSRSRSRSKSSEKRSASPVQKDDDVSNSADDKN